MNIMEWGSGRSQQEMVRFVKSSYCTVLYGIAWYCMVLRAIVWYFMVLSCIDTVEVIVRDCRDTGAGTTENLEQWVLAGMLVVDYKRHKRFWQSWKPDKLCRVCQDSSSAAPSHAHLCHHCLLLSIVIILIISINTIIKIMIIIIFPQSWGALRTWEPRWERTLNRDIWQN